MDLRTSVLLAGMMKHKKSINATIMGNLNIDDNYIVSGFDINNYMKMPDLFRPDNKSWEICFKVKTPISFNARNKFFGNYIDGGDKTCVGMEINRESYTRPCFSVDVSFNGRDWGFVSRDTSHIISTNTIYWFKLEYNGINTYSAKYSLDNTNWITTGTFTTENILYQGTDNLQSIGYDSDSGNSYWGGEIYMAESYIKINGKMWWKGVK